MPLTDNDDPRLGGMLWIVLVQILLTGIYTGIFCQAIVRLVLTGQHKIYATVLLILFVAVVAHSSTNFCELRREILILNSFPVKNGLFTVGIIGDLGAFISMCLGDALLLWRCYILWMQNKILLFIFASVILGETILFAISWTLLSGGHLNLFVAILMFVSLGTTVCATALIIYRIRDMSTDRDGASSKYNFTVQVLVESGALYAAALLVVCVFLVIHSKDIGPQGQVVIFWVGLATPMAGIAPTLIALRVTMKGTRDTHSMVHGISVLQFNRSLPPMNECPSPSIQNE